MDHLVPREESYLFSSNERNNIETSFCTVTVEEKIHIFFSTGKKCSGGDKKCSFFHAPSASTSGYRNQFVCEAQGCRPGMLVPSLFAVFCTYFSFHSITHLLSFQEPRQITF